MTRAPAIGLSRWLTIPEIGGAAGEASTGEETGAAIVHPPEMHTGKSQANAADRRRLITGPEARWKVYDGGKSIATGWGRGVVSQGLWVVGGTENTMAQGFISTPTHNS